MSSAAGSPRSGMTVGCSDLLGGNTKALPKIDVFIVPPEVFHRRRVGRVVWHTKRLSVQRIELVTVVELFPDTGANLKVPVFRDGEVATVVKRMEVAAEQ